MFTFKFWMETHTLGLKGRSRGGKERGLREWMGQPPEGRQAGWEEGL